MDRLTSEGATTYNYDGNGNITQAGTPVVHDGMGNITADSGIVSFGYDAGGRLQTLTRSPVGQPVQTVTNQYNGKGERSFTHRVLSPTLRFVEYYTYAEDGRLLTFVQAAQNTDNTLGVRTVYNYIWLDNIPVAQFRERYSSTGAHMDSQLTYIHADHLYTPQMGTGYSATTQSNETKVWNIWSNAYGYTYEYDNPDGDGSSVNIVLRFPGQVYYGISTFNYNYKRDYDTMGGRYLESDPIGLYGGLNTYAYTGGNPLRWSDPMGLIKWNGTLSGGSLSFGPGAGLFKIEVQSEECINGLRMTAKIAAFAVGFGFGGDLGVNYDSKFKLNDAYNDFRPERLVGRFNLSTFGIGFGPKRNGSPHTGPYGSIGGYVIEMGGSDSRFGGSPARGAALFDFGEDAGYGASALQGRSLMLEPPILVPCGCN